MTNRHQEFAKNLKIKIMKFQHMKIRINSIKACGKISSFVLSVRTFRATVISFVKFLITRLASEILKVKERHHSSAILKDIQNKQKKILFSRNSWQIWSLMTSN